MPAANKLAIAAILAVTVSVAGCNSKKSSAASSTTGLPAAASSAAAAIQSAAAAASAPAASSAGAAPAATSAPAAAGSAAAGCPLTGAQVSTVMGATYADPTVSYGICSYLSSSTGSAFTIQVLNATGDNNFAGTLATAEQDNGTQTTTAIPGVGDKATGVGLEIVVQSGSKVIDVRNADSPGFGSWPKSVALAKLVIASLK